MADAVSIVVPTLNAGRYARRLLDAFAHQSYDALPEVILVDSASDDDTVAIADGYPFCRAVPIARQAFTHGYARNLGVREASGEIVVFVSQDALPRDDHWLANLLSPFQKAETGAVFGRQIPYPDANPFERTFLNYWFPAEDRTTPGLRKDKEAYRFLDGFFSNVNAAARRQLALDHPFLEDIIMSEDQQFARDLLAHGHDIVYAADAEVWHSHDYTLREVFQRYFDSAYSLTCIFNHTFGESLKAGRGYLPHEFRQILTQYPRWFPYYVLYLGSKVSGSLAGHVARHFPDRFNRRLSMHKRFWDREWRNYQTAPDHDPALGK